MEILDNQILKDNCNNKKLLTKYTEIEKDVLFHFLVKNIDTYASAELEFLFHQINDKEYVQYFLLNFLEKYNKIISFNIQELLTKYVHDV